jgi:hypothetical protein
VADDHVLAHPAFVTVFRSIRWWGLAEKTRVPRQRAGAAVQVSTADLMSSVTSCACETIATWLDGTSTMVAPIREANMRSASSLREQRPERLALVEAEGGDVDETDDVWSVRAERRDDLAAVGVSDDDRRARSSSCVELLLRASLR